MLNLAARIAKLVALFGFLLPWVVVSCSGAEIARATGVQLMTGDMQLSGAAEGASAGDGPDPNIVVILACAVIAIGLLASLALRGRQAAIVLAVSSIAAIGAAVYSIEDMRGSLNREMARSQQEAAGGPFGSDEMSRQMAESMRNMIRVEERPGYWVTVGGLGAAAVLSLLSAFGVAIRLEQAKD